jgi:glycosyl transferase family 87
MSAITSIRGWSIDGLPPTQRRGIRDGLIVAGLIFNATLVIFWLPHLYLWIDAEAWWHINLSNLYGPGIGTAGNGVFVGDIGAFRYSPVIAWLFLPATWVSWEALIAVYLALSAVALVAMLGSRAPLFVLAFPPVLLELINGNIHIFTALAIWIGLRWAPAWAFILLTKVTPGVGMLWYVGRREWRNLGIALGATAAIAVVGVVIAPGLWVDWLHSLTTAAGGPTVPGAPTLWVRLPFAAAVAYFAGRTGRAWLVPVSVFLGLPHFWLQGLAILTASFPLYWERDRWRVDGRPMGVTNEHETAPSRAAEVPAT